MKIKTYDILNKYIYVQIILCLISDLLYSYNSFFSVLFYLTDIMNIICIVVFLYRNQKKIMLKWSFDNIDRIMSILFLGYCIISLIWSNYHLYNSAVRIRYIFGGFLMYLICSEYFSIKDFHRFLNIICIMQMANFFLVIYQYFLMNKHPDFCNGIFGFTGYANGIEGMFCLAVALFSFIYFIDGKWGMLKSFGLMGVSCIICAIAEIKLFFVMFLAGVFLVLVFRKKNTGQKCRTIMIVIGLIVLLIISYQILAIIMPENLRVFQSLEEALFYERRTTYAGRTNTISFVYDNLFHNNLFKALIGTGLGSNSSEYIYELGKSFSDFGFIGIGILYMFLGLIFFKTIRAEWLDEVKSSSEQFFSAVYAVMIAISIIVWNCTFTRSTYIIFFFLGWNRIKYRETVYKLR